jgi:dTDP-4-amino-4,6-dideoxygalactose transaminase
MGSMLSTHTQNARFLQLDREFEEHRERYLDAVSAVISSGQVVGGDEVARFEVEIAERSGRAHAVAVASGTDAMQVLLAALGIDRDWKVLVPAYSFLATASPLLHAGAKPVFVDVDEHCHLDLLDVGEISGEDGPCAMVVAGLFGNGLDSAAIESFCAERDILLIEDAAQSFGALHTDHPGGGLGIASTMSFAPTKTLPCFGNMGAVVTDDAPLAERLRAIRCHGRAGSANPALIAGYNSMPSAVGAAMLNVSLEFHDQRQLRRQAIADRYNRAFSGVLGLAIPSVRSGSTTNWHKYVVTLDRRDDLQAFLGKSRIVTQIHYPRLIPEEPIFASHFNRSFPRAERLSRMSLTLPLHPHLTDDEVGYVVDCVLAFCADCRQQ